MDAVAIRPVKKVYSVKEAAEVLGISRSRMYELVRVDGFPMFTIGTRILIPIAGLDNWINSQAGFQ